MEFVLYWIAGGAMLVAMLIVLVLESEADNALQDKYFTPYFMQHPKRVEIIFHILFLLFPIIVISQIILHSISTGRTDLLGIAALFGVTWPIIMIGIHWKFIDIAYRLRISTKKKPEYNSILVAKLKGIGWFLSLVAISTAVIFKLLGIETVWDSTLGVLGMMGIILIPIRKSIRIIRNDDNQSVTENNEVLILDLDGVIRHLDLVTAERAAQSIGFTYAELMDTLWYNEHSYEILCGRSNREEWWEHVRKFDSRLEEVSQDVLWDKVFEISTYNTELIEYVREIKDRFKVIILTNCDKESKVKILEELGEDHPFDEVLSSSDFGVAKPVVRIFEKFLEKIGVNAEQCVFFDDTVANVMGAQDIGIRSFQYQGLLHLRSVIES